MLRASGLSDEDIESKLFCQGSTGSDELKLRPNLGNKERRGSGNTKVRIRSLCVASCVCHTLKVHRRRHAVRSSRKKLHAINNMAKVREQIFARWCPLDPEMLG